MRKFVAIALIAVAVLGVGVLIFAGSIMRTAVEKSGTYALGVETKLDSCSLSPVAGQVGLQGLQIADPAGFKGPYFLRLERAQLNVGAASLLRDVVEAPSFELDGLDMYLERANGHTNYGAILDSLEKLGGSKDKPAKGKPAEGGGKKFIVRDVRLRNLRVHTDFLPELGSIATASVTLPEVHLKNIGTAEGGASVAELVGALVQAVLKAAVEAGVGLPKSLLEDISGALTKLDSQNYKDLEQQLAGNVGGDPVSTSKAIEGFGQDLKKLVK